MAAPTLTTVYDSFFTSTTQKFKPGLQKNFIEYHPIVMMLMDDYKHTDSGGYMIQISAEFGSNSNTTMFLPYSTIDTTPSETAIPAFYPWRHMGSSATISDIEKIANQGKEKLFDLAKSRITQAIRSMSNIAATEFFSDGTNYGGNTVIGLAAGISTTPLVNPASGAVGGIDSTTATGYSFWRNNATTGCGSFAANGVHGATTDLMETAWNNCCDGMREVPTHTVSSQDVYQYYNASLLGTVRYVDPRGKTGDFSFPTLEYKGRPWYWDRNCPSGRAYFINLNHVYCTIDPEMNFTWTEPRSWPNQLVQTRLVTLRFAVVWNARMFHAVTDGWTA